MNELAPTTIAEQWSSLQMLLQAHRPASEPAAQVCRDATTPVVLLTGFLGSGKSTLVVDLLSNPPHGVRIHAVVNDVGSLPFDPTLIDVAGELDVELTNGCGCCQNTGDLVTALDEASKADLVVLEASGIADPIALAHVVEARPDLRLDRVVCVVSAGALDRHLSNPATASLTRRQLESAHVVVVSHSEVAEQNHLTHVLELVSEIAPGRPLICSSLRRPATIALTPSGPLGARLPVADPISGETISGEAVITMMFVQAESITEETLDARLRNRPSSVLRAKGILRSAEQTLAVQTTPDGYQLSPVDPSRSDGLTVTGTCVDDIVEFARTLGCLAAPRHD